MWKLLIADDEPRIRRGLRKALPYEEYNIEVIGEAEDGEMALEIALKEKPDILFVDINMPFLNGLEFIEKLNENLVDSIIIVISGYDDFEYAQKALRMKVFDYILKPVKLEELKNVVKQAQDRLEERKNINSFNSWSKNCLQDNLEEIREGFLLKWLKGEISQEEFRENLEFYDIKLESFSGMFMIKWDKRNSNLNVEEGFWDTKVKEVKALVSEILSENRFNLVLIDENGYIITISHINKNIMEWMDLKNDIVKKCKEKFKLDLIITLQICSDIIADGSKSYLKLVKDMKEGGKCTPIVARAKIYIDRNYYKQDLSLTEVASRVQVSSDYLSKLIKKELGMNFSDYVTKIRVENAIQFMNDPSVKFYEIAEQVGYSSQHYFSTAFKKVKGVSPLTYKNGGNSND